MGLFGPSEPPKEQKAIQASDPGRVVEFPKKKRDHVLKRTRNEDATSTQQKDKQVRHMEHQIRILVIDRW